MTGSLLLNRQHSSTASNPKKNKMIRPKYRRCSSADENNSLEIISKEKLFTKFEPTSSDNDSGIEDFDQHVANVVDSQTNNMQEEIEESSPCFGPCEDEDVEENVTPTNIQIFEYPQEDLQVILNDLSLAAKVTHEEKKEFCSNTSEVFHAEFSRLISFPISLNYPGLRYYLLVEDGVMDDPSGWPDFAYVKLDNAKAQFKCPNPNCCRLWTSMRGRISFTISRPSPQGFVVLKIFGQNCQSCGTPADALWYMEEVCRVMKNLSQSIFQTLFYNEIQGDYLEGTEMSKTVKKYSPRSRHDPHQRKGKMHAPHNTMHCEACQRGLCFI